MSNTTTSACRISKVETTEDTLSSRGGLALFVRYLDSISILNLLLPKLGFLKKNTKGAPMASILKQVLCFFFDGTSRHLTYFDELKKDPGYAAVIETRPEEMVSSHTVKRLLRAVPPFCAAPFRWILQRLFVWRLCLDKPEVILLTLDTMVMDNDEALKREGCEPTYKKKKGFQPLQLIWEGKIVDAIFRSGSKHSNYDKHVIWLTKTVVHLIRRHYRRDVPIILRLDSGFFDEDNFKAFDELEIGFIATGKTYDSIKKTVAAIPPAGWTTYDNGRQQWSYASFDYRCESWSKELSYPALYTRPKYEDGGQELLEFARPDNIILTNMTAESPVISGMPEEIGKYWLSKDGLIAGHHARGADELPHRGLKDFGSEELPCKKFGANTAWYYLMLIAFFLFETFKEDVASEILPMGCYATTVRRRLVDMAAKIVRSGRTIVLKVSKSAMETLRLDILWERCLLAPEIRI